MTLPSGMTWCLGRGRGAWAAGGSGQLSAVRLLVVSVGTDGCVCGGLRPVVWLLGGVEGVCPWRLCEVCSLWYGWAVVSRPGSSRICTALSSCVEGLRAFLRSGQWGPCPACLGWSAVRGRRGWG